ncbi:TRAPPC8 family protein [Megaselia abdita]
MINLSGNNCTPFEMVRNIFSPLVSVVTSPLVDEICHKNNLSFVELLQPFSKLSSEAQIRDTTGTSISNKNLKLNICDIFWRPPQTVLARKMLNEVVTAANSDKTKFVSLVNGLELEVPSAEPWFENWKETFFSVQFPSEHEFTRNFLSCIIVLSSSDTALLDTANQLTQKIHMMQNMTPPKLPKWFQPNDVLNTYLLLHEGSTGDISRAQQSFEVLKSNFGESRCFLLQINSATGNGPSEVQDYWTPYIRRQPKTENIEQSSTPRTPQDILTVSTMPTSLNISNLDSDTDSTFLHPLSPQQEQATEAIHSKFSISSESISSQTINPNVWASLLDVDTPLGSCLTQNDVENLKHFVQDYTLRALIPYVERLLVILNESVTNKKVSKTLFGATKRWFGTNKPGAKNTQNSVVYTNESTELQTRKLGDLYFMFGHYNMAFQAYHQAKRDFNADSAWLYYAGALEMASLSAFMLGTVDKKTYAYMEDAIVCYLTVCKLQQFATRATLLSVECLKNARLYGEAAKQLIRMTSEESDLRSALLLEQAAYCFLASNPAMYRKYAFHIVLSGNRFSRAGQRKHAYRCYRQALQIYQDRGWSLAEDHIQYTIGKQAFTLRHLEISCQVFGFLLRATSMQNSQQQLIFLKEYIQAMNELSKKSPEIGLLELALPKIVQNSLRVLVTSHPPVASPLYVQATNVTISMDLKHESIWLKMEEMLVNTANPKIMVFKPTKNLFTYENPSTEHPLSAHGEPIEIQVKVANVMKTPIVFSKIDLMWEFKTEDGTNTSTTDDYASVTASPPEVTIEENSEKLLNFKVTPKLLGTFIIVGLKGEMSISLNEPQLTIEGCMRFETQQIRPIKPNAPPQFDSKLLVKVLPPAPALKICFSQTPKDVLTGEILPLTMSLLNTGRVAVDEIFVCCDKPRFITFCDENTDVPLSILRDIKDLSNETLGKDKELRNQHVFKILKSNGNEGTSLKPDEKRTINMWIQAPYQKGEFKLKLLIYSSLPKDYPFVKHRLVRHEYSFMVHECLLTELSCVVSNTATNSLGLDLKLKNMNQIHHPYMTEIYVNSIQLLSSEYKLNSDKIIFMNQIDIANGQLGDKCLKSSKSTSLQCRLNSFQPTNSLTNNEFVCNRLSSLKVSKLSNSDEVIPSIKKLYSFLMKNETKFLNPLTATIEEFNAIMSTFDPHLSIVINWTALIIDGSESTNRTAQGQHFIQLRNFYERISCPETTESRIRNYLSDASDYQPIHRCHDVLERKSSNIGDDDDDEWEVNNNFVGRRCVIEDETFNIAGKVY